MAAIDKAEKALEFLKQNTNTARSHELQNAAGSVGRCLGALGSRSNLFPNYVSMFSKSVPVLLSLASHDNAEIRLLGDEALNRAIVGGYSFHASKVNSVLQNHIDSDKNARWNRAILSRIYVGETWLRPANGKLRAHIQQLFPKFLKLLKNTNELQLVVEMFEQNLARILAALADYCTDEEILDLTKSFLEKVDSSDASVRRSSAFCVGVICKYNKTVVGHVLNRIIDNLWPATTNSDVIVGWFSLLKAIFTHSTLESLDESDHFSVKDYLEIYQLCVNYLEICNQQHNIQNAVLECLNSILLSAYGEYKEELLNKKPKVIEIGLRQKERTHSRCRSSLSMTAQSVKSLSSRMSDDMSNTDVTENDLSFCGALHLGSLSELQTPMRSSEDLSFLQTPDSPCSDLNMENSVYLSKHLSEKLTEIMNESSSDCESNICDIVHEKDNIKKINIGSSIDEAIRLKYCFRLIASKFLLTGNTAEIICDKSVRVSLKSNALNCLAAILNHYPEVVTFYLDVDTQNNLQNNSNTTNCTERSKLGTSNAYILERNICFQDSITESFSREIMNKSDENKLNTSNTSKDETHKSYPTEKDVASNILDSRTSGQKHDMAASHATNLSSDFPMTNSDGSKEIEHKPLVRTDEVDCGRLNESIDMIDQSCYQHLSDIFVLFENHGDPQIRSVIRTAICNYLRLVLDLTKGDYYKWIFFERLSEECLNNLGIEGLIHCVLRGVSDEAQSCTNTALSALSKIIHPLALSVHANLIEVVLNALINVEYNKYWLCKVNLCKFYEALPYEKLLVCCSSFKRRLSRIYECLLRLLSENDHRVRNSATNAILENIPYLHLTPSMDELNQLVSIYHSQTFYRDHELIMNQIKIDHCLKDLPLQLIDGAVINNSDSLRNVVERLVFEYMGSGDRSYSQGLLETLHKIVLNYPPWKNMKCYIDQGVLELCLDLLDYTSLTILNSAMLMDLCSFLYPVEIYKCLYGKAKNQKDSPTKEKWVHIENEKISRLAEKFMTITLKMLNILTHLVEDININVYFSKNIVLPGSPVRKKSQEPLVRRSNTSIDEDKVRRRPLSITHNVRANFIGHFVNDPFFVKLYESLRSAFSNHKVSIDQSSSLFNQFLQSTLNSLSIQLELNTENEFNQITEEILYYLRALLPFKMDKVMYSVTQLLKCLFGTNMAGQFDEYCDLFDHKQDVGAQKSKEKSNIETILFPESVDGNSNMPTECDILKRMEKLQKLKMEKRWTNKKDLEINIKLFEPIVVQGMRSYTRQHDINLQCEVLRLLRQLLCLRINYCSLDSEQTFLNFVLKQMDLIEQHEIPNSCSLAHCIIQFLVQLSVSKYHTKQIMEVPKVLQLCDGLLASGCEEEAIIGLGPLVMQGFFGLDAFALRNQDAQVAREVLFYMLLKTMNYLHIVNLTTSVLCMSSDNKSTYRQLSEQAFDSLMIHLETNSIEMNSERGMKAVERLVDYIHPDIFVEQSKLETVLKILFRRPPDQNTASTAQKHRYIASNIIILRKILPKNLENDILHTINYLKAKNISPKSIYFNVKNEVDPLNVNSYNESCANLESDVVLARFFLRLLAYTIMEAELNLERDTIMLHSYTREKDEHKYFIFSILIDLIVAVKDLLHLNDSSKFPQTSKTCSLLLHNEQSNFNTGLYDPEENIPLSKLNSVILRLSHIIPSITLHWSHLFLRLKFLERDYWECILGCMKDSPYCEVTMDAKIEFLQIGGVFALCEYFLENGLDETTYLTWLIVNRIKILMLFSSHSMIKRFLDDLHANSSASTLLLQAVAARCQRYMKGAFALQVFEALQNTHVSQTGVLVFLICRVIGKLELAVGRKFAQLAVDRLVTLMEMPAELGSKQLSKDDVTIAFEILKREGVCLRHPSLLAALNSLATSVLDMSPLDMTSDRAVKPQNVLTTNVNEEWLYNQIKIRCCCIPSKDKQPKINKRTNLARALIKLNAQQLNALFNCNEFDRNILSYCFKIACDDFLKDFTKVYCVYEAKELEIDMIKERKSQEVVLKEESSSFIDNNILSVTNFVKFKRNDSKDNKSHFFVPIKEEKAIDLKIEQTVNELVTPNIQTLHTACCVALNDQLAAILKTFPRQSRPLSQSENFNLNLECNVDRYTHRCHQVFMDKLFYHEFCTLHKVMAGLLKSFSRIKSFLDTIVCENKTDLINSVLPENLSRNIAIFSIISLQYMSFLIKNKDVIESGGNSDVSFRVEGSNLEQVCLENVLEYGLKNVAMALSFDEIWSFLDSEGSCNRVLSGVCCVYTIVKYLVQDKRPISLSSHFRDRVLNKSDDFALTCDKLLTLIEYFEFSYINRSDEHIDAVRNNVEQVLVRLSRLSILNTIALIPPMAWPSMEIELKENTIPNCGLPLHMFEDSDVLETFLFRIHFIGWSSKKLFEEIWMALLFALQGNGTHWAVKGITQLLLSSAKKCTSRYRRNNYIHCPRSFHRDCTGMQILRALAVGNENCESIFDNVDMERVPFAKEKCYDFGYHYGQFSVEYLRYSAGVTTDAPFHVKTIKTLNTQSCEVDIKSCLQLLMDIATEMLSSKSETGLSAKCNLISCLVCISDLFTEISEWIWLSRHLITLTSSEFCNITQYSIVGQYLLYGLARSTAVLYGVEGVGDTTTVYQKLVKSLASSHAPLKMAALQGCLLLVNNQKRSQTDAQLVGQLVGNVTQYLSAPSKISLYEQSLYWTLLFTLVEFGNFDLMNRAVEFVVKYPKHFCADLVISGVTNMIRQSVLPKDLKKSIICRLLDEKKKYLEENSIQLLMVHLFSADDKLISPRLTPNVSDMDPDILMSSMERLTLLYKTLRQTNKQANMQMCVSALKYFLRETLPPIATLSRVVIEFLESCKDAELFRSEVWIQRSLLNAEIVYEVFETGVTQNQLPTLIVWIFEAMTHLLSGKISNPLIPACLLNILIFASPNDNIRKLSPVAFNTLKQALTTEIHANSIIHKLAGKKIVYENNMADSDDVNKYGECSKTLSQHNLKNETNNDYLELDSLIEMCFVDRRLLCVTALHSEFSYEQLEKLRELALLNGYTNDLLCCLNVALK